MQAPDWSLQFELMGDSSDVDVGDVLGQKKDSRHYVICYISKALDPHNATTP